MPRPIDLYALFRLKDIRLIGELNRLMSGKHSTVKKHEIESLQGLANVLTDVGATPRELDGYYFSYTIPKIGKEFDVLRISEEFVLNIELKYVNVGEKEIAEQIRRNEYYLKSLGKKYFICTYVCDENRFYTVDDNDKLVDCDVNRVFDAVLTTNDFYSESPDRLFDPEDFIFSPLDDPERVLEGRYFLTQHQESIEKKLLGLNSHSESRFSVVSGGSGTGKTLLLYDLALKTAKLGDTCIISSDGSSIDKAKNTIANIDIMTADEYFALSDSVRACRFVFIDDAHYLSWEKIDVIVKECNKNRSVCVFFTDSPTLLNSVPKTKVIWNKLKRLAGQEKHQLTDRIHTNPQIAAFVNGVLNKNTLSPEGYRIKYGEVFALYASTRDEAHKIIERYAEKGYQSYIPEAKERAKCTVGRRLVVLGRAFEYDADGYLCTASSNSELMWKLVFEGFRGADESLGILVVGNKSLFKSILEIFSKE